MTNVFLSGQKTVLRPISLSDIPLFTRWMNDPETRKYLLQRFPMTEGAEKAWVEKNSVMLSFPERVVFVIETKAEGKAIGTIGLNSINWINRNTATGTTIGEAEFRGKGYASDAKMTLLKYAFETLGMHKIISRAFATNTKSIEYSKRCGYVVEATLKEEIFSGGKWEDIVLLACFYPEWKKVAEKI